LDVLSATGGCAVPVRALVTVAGPFEITENSLRVALARLLSRGVVERDERAQYRIAPGAAAVQSHVASWAQVEDTLVPWRGDWIGVHTAGLKRSWRAALRRRLRALDFLGFRALETDLWVRPDNFLGGVTHVRHQLRDLGLGSKAPVFAMAQLDAHTEARARALWNVMSLQASYQEMRIAIVRSARRLPFLPIEKAMAECFILGGKALRQIAFDPLLPEPILPGEKRHRFIEEMRRYDRQGREYWWKFMRGHGADDFVLPLQLHALDAIAPPRAAAEGGA
jgi:phenylacetic acid degradation operon negative regulatory protein